MASNDELLVGEMKQEKNDKRKTEPAGTKKEELDDGSFHAFSVKNTNINEEKRNHEPRIGNTFESIEKRKKVKSLAAIQSNDKSQSEAVKMNRKTHLDILENTENRKPIELAPVNKNIENSEEEKIKSDQGYLLDHINKNRPKPKNKRKPSRASGPKYENASYNLFATDLTSEDELLENDKLESSENSPGKSHATDLKNVSANKNEDSKLNAIIRNSKSDGNSPNITDKSENKDHPSILKIDNEHRTLKDKTDVSEVLNELNELAKQYRAENSIKNKSNHFVKNITKSIDAYLSDLNLKFNDMIKAKCPDYFLKNGPENDANEKTVKIKDLKNKLNDTIDALFVKLDEDLSEITQDLINSAGQKIRSFQEEQLKTSDNSKKSSKNDRNSMPQPEKYDELNKVPVSFQVRNSMIENTDLKKTRNFEKKTFKKIPIDSIIIDNEVPSEHSTDVKKGSTEHDANIFANIITSNITGNGSRSSKASSHESVKTEATEPENKTALIIEDNKEKSSMSQTRKPETAKTSKVVSNTNTSISGEKIFDSIRIDPVKFRQGKSEQADEKKHKSSTNVLYESIYSVPLDSLRVSSVKNVHENTYENIEIPDENSGFKTRKSAENLIKNDSVKDKATNDDKKANQSENTKQDTYLNQSNSNNVGIDKNNSMVGKDENHDSDDGDDYVDPLVVHEVNFNLKRKNGIIKRPKTAEKSEESVPSVTNEATTPNDEANIEINDRSECSTGVTQVITPTGNRIILPKDLPEQPKININELLNLKLRKFDQKINEAKKIATVSRALSPKKKENDKEEKKIDGNDCSNSAKNEISPSAELPNTETTLNNCSDLKPIEETKSAIPYKPLRQVKSKESIITDQKNSNTDEKQAVPLVVLKPVKKPSQNNNENSKNDNNTENKPERFGLVLKSKHKL